VAVIHTHGFINFIYNKLKDKLVLGGGGREGEGGTYLLHVLSMDHVFKEVHKKTKKQAISPSF
jgi:hypothetical protein